MSFICQGNVLTWSTINSFNLVQLDENYSKTENMIHRSKKEVENMIQ